MSLLEIMAASAVTPSDYDSSHAPFSSNFMSTNSNVYLLDFDTTDAGAGTHLGITQGASQTDATHSGGGVYEQSNSSIDNGGQIIYSSNGGWNNHPSLEVRPATLTPTGYSNSGYVGFLDTFNPNSGSDATQINLNFMVYFGTAWPGLPKFYVTNDAGSTNDHRYMMFSEDPENTSDLAFGPSIGTWANYAPIGLSPLDDANAGTCGLEIASSANHTATPPVMGYAQWYCMEIELTFDQGTSDRNLVRVYSSDSNLSGAYVQRTYSDHGVPGDEPHPGNDTWGGLEGFGWFYNTPLTGGANSGMKFSYMRISKNRGASNPIGPPSGFVT